MAVKRNMGVAEIVRAWEEGLLIRGEVPSRLMRVINEANVDEVIGNLSPEVREIFIEFAKIHYLGGELISLERPELDEGPLPAKSLAAVRSWFQRHG
jgi:hypothetical protein